MGSTVCEGGGCDCGGGILASGGEDLAMVCVDIASVGSSLVLLVCGVELAWGFSRGAMEAGGVSGMRGGGTVITGRGGGGVKV